MKKALLVATVVKTHIKEFHLPFLKLLQEMGYETSVAARNDYEKDEDCRITYCDKYYDIQFQRSPFTVLNWKAYRQLKKIVEENKFDIVHCHTPVGGVLVRLAARKVRKAGTKVIYTAHGFHFYKGAPLLNWLVYYPVEWICSWFTDVLITINQEDYAFAKKYMRAKKIVYVPGVGIDLDKYKKIELSKAKRQVKRQELGLQPHDKMLLSVGELNKNKNHEIVIRALAGLRDSCIHYYIAGNGPLKEYLENLAKELGVCKQVHLLGYRDDIVQLLQITDLFIFPSHREGLPVSLMEAIACRIPLICSDIRGNRNLVTNCVLFNQNDAADVEKKIKQFLACANENEDRLNYESLQKFSLENVLGEMKRVYGQFG